MDISKIKNKDSVIAWFNSFADLIQDAQPNLYEQACEYADAREVEN